MLSEIFEGLPVAVCAADAEGRVAHCNAAARALLGAGLATGASRWQAAPFHHPDGRPMRQEESALARVLAEGQPACVGAVVEGPDGRRVAIRSQATPLRDAAGRLIGAVEVVLEAGGSGESDEIALARLAAIVASSDDAIISKTLEGVVTSWNAGATRIFGHEAEEMIGQPIIRIIPAELRGEEEAILARLRRGERIDHFDTERITKDGRRVFISLTISPIRNGAGEIVGASKVARDVTERKRAEEIQTLLLGELNHRVKNTLATIQAIARQSLRLEPNPSAFVASFTGRVQALARAHDILGQHEMQRAELADLVREQVVLGSEDARISLSGPKVALDSRTALQLALVVHELATNARKYGALSTAAGALAIGWTHEPADAGSELVLTWRETGAGGHDGPVTRGFGTLLIERSLLSNGGRATVRRLPDGFACEIRLPLPGAAPGMPERAAGSPGARDAEGGEQSALAGLRILVVEDEPLIAMDIEERLLAAGSEVIGPAANLETARRLIAETSPDAALLDANLAGLRVDDLAKELRRRRIPFAFATGFGRASLPEAFQDAPVLSKPFGSEQLVEMVRRLVAGRAEVPAVRGGSEG